MLRSNVHFVFLPVVSSRLVKNTIVTLVECSVVHCTKYQWMFVNSVYMFAGILGSAYACQKNLQCIQPIKTTSVLRFT
jgi:hypothetical protein